MCNIAVSLCIANNKYFLLDVSWFFGGFFLSLHICIIDIGLKGRGHGFPILMCILMCTMLQLVRHFNRQPKFDSHALSY